MESNDTKNVMHPLLGLFRHGEYFKKKADAVWQKFFDESVLLHPHESDEYHAYYATMKRRQLKEKTRSDGRSTHKIHNRNEQINKQTEGKAGAMSQHAWLIEAKHATASAIARHLPGMSYKKFRAALRSTEKLPEEIDIYLTKRLHENAKRLIFSKSLDEINFFAHELQGSIVWPLIRRAAIILAGGFVIEWTQLRRGRSGKIFFVPECSLIDFDTVSKRFVFVEGVMRDEMRWQDCQSSYSSFWKDGNYQSIGAIPLKESKPQKIYKDGQEIKADDNIIRFGDTYAETGKQGLPASKERNTRYSIKKTRRK